MRYILDFRDEKEAAMAKDIVPDKATYEQISALRVEKHDDNGFDFESIMKGSMNEQKFEYILAYLKEGYKKMPFDNPAYKTLFELLLKGDGCVYFHCTVGKDRTGIAGFLIMTALGMSEDDAVKEYLLSNKYLKMADGSGVNLAEKLNIPEEYIKMCTPILGVQEEFIRLSINEIKEKYRDYDEFLFNEYELDEKKRRELISIYCE